MAACPKCSSEIPDGSRFCPGCGAVQSSVSQMPTQVAPATGSGATPTPTQGGRTMSTPIGRLDSSASFAGAAFQPGQMLAGRYRIIGLLGRGGMGDVYRADDVELGQAVALKFLGRMYSDRPDMLERFRAEVRNARGVSHPNVCRVYDIGEVEGQTFLSMEYVDGEDLGSLLKRIGRLPRTKADEVARQLCAGLAAAHDRGVIHRDLKPSNIMIDGEGHVRIADFGLAVRSDSGVGEVVGTPAYMAPEQFEGKPATPQTDLYSLGLILYEVHTGKRAFDATTWDGWKSQHSQVEPRSPEEIEREVDEAVVRAIMRCLEKEPAKRPRSAMELAASLPGGDPVAAALAAGEMPSPDMVAASGGHGTTTSRAAVLLLVGFLLLLAGYLVMAPAATDLGLAPLRKGKEALLANARDIAAKLGYTETPVDEDAAFERDYNPLVYRARNEESTHWRKDHARTGPPLKFGYRSSKTPFRPISGGRVTAEDPIPIAEGNITVRTDAEGRLRTLIAVPPRLDSLPPTEGTPLAGTLFMLAGLDTSRFEETTPSWRPLLPFDSRREWLGESDLWPGARLRVNAAWWHGRPVTFGIRGPWDDPQVLGRVATGNPIAGATRMLIALSLITLCFVSGAARLRTGKSDWRGGLRFANVIVSLFLVNWLFSAHHTLVLDAEGASLGHAFSQGITAAFIIFFIYVVIEPEVRRRTPELLVGWTRLIKGSWTDARVGRDILVGGVAGAASAFLMAVVNGLPTWIPFKGQTPIPPNTDMISGGPYLFAQFTAIPLNTINTSFSLFGVWFMLWLVFRRKLPAAVGLAVVMTLLSLGAENPTLEVPGAILDGILVAYVITRHGLLALVSLWTVRLMIQAIPAPFTTTSPHAFSAFVAIAVPAGIVLFAFRNTSRALPQSTGGTVPR